MYACSKCLSLAQAEPRYSNCVQKLFASIIGMGDSQHLYGLIDDH